jgi:glycosyltransferase involved in cell wall biosynthesis
VQAGHRERYGVPRALERADLLDTLVTDLWLPPGSPVARLLVGALGRRLRDRFHPELPRAKVRAHAWRTLAWETRNSGGARVLARNAWWSATAARTLRRHANRAVRHVFSYCYEARGLFAAARAVGLVPILGQIDPGPVEDRKVAALVRRWPRYRTGFVPGAPAYYEAWRDECRLAGAVVVNSRWSREALIEAGVPAEKIRVCPLVYTPPEESRDWNKAYPATFSPGRPLRVLFLGQCILRKGIAETIEAAHVLADRPVEFTCVGNTDIADFSGHFGRARIRHVPRVSRAECHAFYREADVFLFPTHSDGFGLTQLEAQAWKLPSVTSRFCAEVVEHGRTGWVLPEVSAAGIVATMDEILRAPAVLDRMSRAIGPWRFGPDELGAELRALGEAAR